MNGLGTIENYERLVGKAELSTSLPALNQSETVLLFMSKRPIQDS